MELKGYVFSSPELPAYTVLGIHSMELKALCTATTSRASATLSRIHSMELKGVSGEMLKEMMMLGNPFNGIERCSISTRGST